MGVWIETLPEEEFEKRNRVTPYVGVWIETWARRKNVGEKEVTPYVGVWIETKGGLGSSSTVSSLLMWECGLKLIVGCTAHRPQDVTPYVGVWIETVETANGALAITSHSLCGSVD